MVSKKSGCIHACIHIDTPGLCVYANTYKLRLSASRDLLSARVAAKCVRGKFGFCCGEEGMKQAVIPGFIPVVWVHKGGPQGAA